MEQTRTTRRRELGAHADGTPMGFLRARAERHKRSSLEPGSPPTRLRNGAKARLTGGDAITSAQTNMLIVGFRRLGRGSRICGRECPRRDEAIGQQRHWCHDLEHEARVGSSARLSPEGIGSIESRSRRDLRKQCLKPAALVTPWSPRRRTKHLVEDDCKRNRYLLRRLQS